MPQIKNILLAAAMAAAITLSGCSAPSGSASHSLPQAESSTPPPSVSATPDTSATQPEAPPAVSEPEPITPPAVSESEASPLPEAATPEPCAHTQTTTTVTQAATCTAQGHGTAVCTACGEVVASASIPPLGHDYQQTAATEAACETVGSRTLTCSRCNDTKTESVPALGHSWSDATCTMPATCTVCKAAGTEPADHSWVVKYAMGTPECQWCGAKYAFDALTLQTNYLDVPILVGSKSITLIDFTYRLSAFEGPFTLDSPCRLDITIDGIASNACTMTRSSHLIAPDGTKITSIYDNHGTTNPICDGSFTETFSFDIPAATGTYTFVFSAQ